MGWRRLFFIFSLEYIRIIFKLSVGKKFVNAFVLDSEVVFVSDSYGMSYLFYEFFFFVENIKFYICYEIRVYALLGDRGRCSFIRGNFKYKGEFCDFWLDFVLV